MAPFFLQRKKGAGSGRVFAFASIANQPHTLENRYVPGSGVGARSIANRRALVRAITYRPPATIPSSGLIYSKNNVTDGGFTVGNSVEKDMDNLLRGITTLYEIILHAKQIISMPDGNTKNDNRIKLMLKVFYQFKLSQIKTMPNAFYHWNEYYFNRQLIKCQTYTV